MKKVLLIIGLLALVVGGSAAYFWFFKGWLKEYPQAARAMPEDAFLMYKSADVQSTFNDLLQTSIGQKVKQHPHFQDFKTRFHYLDSITDQMEDIQQLKDEHPLHIALINPSVDELNLLFLLQTDRLGPGRVIRESLENWKSALQFNSRGFRGYGITDVTTVKGRHILSYASIEGILAISANPLLLEESIRTFNSRVDSALQGPAKALTQSGMKEQVVANFKQMPAFLGTFMHSKSRLSLKKTGLLKGYGTYQLDLNEETIELHGEFKEHESVLMNHLRKRSPQESQIPRAIPRRTAVFASFLIPDPGKYLNDLSASLKAKNEYLKFKHQKDSLENAGNFDLEKDFLPVLGNELAWVMNEPVSERFQQNIFLAMYCKDVEDNLEALEALNEKIEANRQSTTEPIHYKGHAIKRAAFSDIFELLYGDLFTLNGEPFYVSVGDHILFASARDPLKRAIDDIEAGQTLSASSHYTRLSEHLLSESNFYFYLNPERSSMLPFNFLSDSLTTAYRSQLNFFKNFGGLTFQLASEGQSYFSQATLQQSVTDVQKTELLWKKSLDTTLAKQPQMVKNHEVKSKELFLVDANHKVYLTTSSGDTRWQRALEGPVMGDVTQIDFYRNDNWQYCFATQNNLQLIDRKGNDVANFPISFSAPAVTDLAVFDYQDSKNYRYFIGKNNRGIYGYRTSGQPLDGWSPKRIKNLPDQALKYFIYQGRTYIFTASNKGTFHLWYANGKEVFEPKALDTRFKSEFEIEFGDSKASTYLMATDTSGTVRYFYLDGSMGQRKFGDWGKGHYFKYLDVNRDESKELIFAEGTTVKGFKQDSTEVFSLTLPDSLAFEPEFYDFNDEYHIGYGTRQTDQIFMMDLDGTFKKGFPVNGSTPFIIEDINDDGELEMVVGGNNNQVYMYRINE